MSDPALKLSMAINGLDVSLSVRADSTFVPRLVGGSEPEISAEEFANLSWSCLEEMQKVLRQAHERFGHSLLSALVALQERGVDDMSIQSKP